MTRHPLVLLTASLALVLATIGVAPTYAGGPAAPRAVQQSKKITVQWQGWQKKPKYVKTADVPGVGQVDLVCRPNSTMIRMHAADRRAENQMWLAKFETKDGTDRVAVKNVRVYTYATAADDGKGGTGSQAHEGLNQKTPIEDFEKGTAYGVISKRPGRNQPGGGVLGVPATAFRLTWYWERFAYPGSQFCKMTLELNTDTDRQFGLSWHGSDEAQSSTSSTSPIAGFGEAQLSCETGDQDERPTIALKTDDPASYMDYEVVQGEGGVNNPDIFEDYDDLTWDPVTGLLGPVRMPRNGMMRIWWSVNGVKQAWAVSSYAVLNNKRRPELNLCEIAAAPLP